jgi:hypothetical protein
MSPFTNRDLNYIIGVVVVVVLVLVLAYLVSMVG